MDVETLRVPLMILVIPPTAIAPPRIGWPETIPVMPATFSIGPILPSTTTETLGVELDACTRSRNSIRYAYDSGIDSDPTLAI